ncbi:hypothetical protein BC832DRAFT_560793 [Gaertneriomyces semiglobifer]|nr:hypothetical protein BC832DRAFT_560793 [Gaertneriomyces semiglobifer]
MATKLVCFLFAVTLLVTPSLARPAPQSEAEPIGPCTSCPSVPVGQFVTCPNVSRGSIDVTSISLSPIPLRRGQNATLSVSGNLTQSVIQVANASIDITRGVFTSTNTVNLCDALSGVCAFELRI